MAAGLRKGALWPHKGKFTHMVPSVSLQVHPHHQLTRRELEVVGLLMKGKSNRELAKELVVAVPTAERHVVNILCKLGLRSRVQVAIWGMRHLPELG